jgi:membrane protein required for colicin V production
MLTELDWVIIAVVALSSLVSLFRGFVKEALSLVAWIAAFAVALVFSGHLSVLVEGAIEHPGFRYLVAFGVLFLVSLVLGALLSRLVSSIVKQSVLSGLDRLLGVVFGFARGVVILLVLLVFVVPLLQVEQYSWWTNSVLVPELRMLEGWFRELATETGKFFSTLA